MKRFIAAIATVAVTTATAIGSYLWFKKRKRTVEFFRKGATPWHR